MRKRNLSSPTHVWVVAWLFALGCAGEPVVNTRSAPGPRATAQPTSGPTSTTAPAPPSAVPTLSASPPEPKAVLGTDHRSAAPCASDADCGWDDPCMPTRCMASEMHDMKCSESRPPPGACLCVAGACTLKPKTPPSSTQPCAFRGCVVDRAGGRCVADTGGVAENFRTNPPVSTGPSCDCVKPATGCTFTWHDPVPCKTVRDCWIELDPRPHPVKRPAHLRGREFKPCHDGEISPACNDAGQCVLGLGWRC